MNSIARKRLAVVFACTAMMCLATATRSPAADEPAFNPNTTPAQPGLVRQEFVYNDAPFRECHASTIEESGDSLVAAWFGGTREKDPDVGIWVSRMDAEGKWSGIVEVANGVEDATTRYPCWNPVLFQPADGPLLLFYKVGPSPRTWWGMLTTSADHGKTWSKPTRLPEGIAGPIKNKPVQLANGVLLCPSSSEDQGWRVHMEMTSDHGVTWKRTEALNDGVDIAAIQPTVLFHGERLQALCRSRGLGRILETWSEDNGKTWSAMTAITLPNPNSGIDAVTLKDGRGLLVYNHTTRGRSPLNVAVTDDGGTWQAAMVLENQPGEYSYPAVIQTSDGMVHISYTWKRRRLKHIVVDPSQLKLRPIVDGRWPR